MLDQIPKERGIEAQEGETITVQRIFALLVPTPLSAVNHEARSFLPAGHTYRINTDRRLNRNYTVRQSQGPEDCSIHNDAETPKHRRYLADESGCTSFTKINFERDIIRLTEPIYSRRGPSEPYFPILEPTLDVFFDWMSEDFCRNVQFLAMDHETLVAWMLRPATQNPPTEQEHGSRLLSFPNLKTVYLVFKDENGVRSLNWQRIWSRILKTLAQRNKNWHLPKLEVVRKDSVCRVLETVD